MTTNSTPSLWFGAPDIAANDASPAGQQFMDLFGDPAAWQATAGASVGFVLTETFVLTATDQQLRQVLGFLSQHHLKLMMVTAMVPVQANGAGNDREGFTAGSTLSDAVRRISRLGGTLDYVAMDSPLGAGHEAPGGPLLSIPDLARQVAGNVALIKAVFPNVKFEDGVGLQATPDLAAWAQAFKAATGSPISQVDADVNWSAPGVTGQLEAFAQAVRATGAAFGIAGNSTTAFTTDLGWALAAEANIAAAEADPLIRPANIEVETWDPNPTVTLPEGLSGTLSHVAVEAAEVTPLYASGFLVGGAGVVAHTAVPSSSYVGSAADAVAGAAVAVPGVAVGATGASATGATFAVVVTDVSGGLGAAASGAGHVSGQGSGVLLLTGRLADVNAELASLTYTGAAAGNDVIDVTTYDGAGLVDDHQLLVAVAAPVAVTLAAGTGAAALHAHIYGTTATAADLAPVRAALAAGKTLAQAAAPWIAQAQATVAALYEQVQGRSPLPDVLANWTAALAGGEGVGAIRAALAGATVVQSELAALFQSRYGRIPSAAQLAALTQQLAAGAGLQAVEAPLLAGSQAEAQVAALFQQVQGQAPDAADLAAQARALLTGTKPAAIRGTLAAAAVVQAGLSALFQHVHDVTPTAAQLASLTAQLAGGTSYAQIEAQFTAAAQGIVTAAYASVLGRGPTASELGLYTNRLVAGVIEGSTVTSALAFSAESGANVTAMYRQVIGQAPPQSMVTTLEQCLCIGSSPIPLGQLKTDLGTAASLYQGITGQTVTAAALSPLMYDFLNKATVDQISAGIAHSGPVIQTLEDTYRSLFGYGINAGQLGALQAELQAGTATMAGVRSALTAQAAADVPVLSDAVASQYDAENASVAPFGALGLTDPDPGAVERVVVTVTGSGHFSGWGTSQNVAGTLFTFQGTASAVQANLRALRLVDPVAGATTTVSLTVRNGAGHSADDTVTITTNALRSAAPTNFVFMPTAGDTVASSGNDSFVFPAVGFGNDTITGFNLARDLIQLPKAMVAGYAGVQTHEASSAGGTMIGFGSSESIFLPGVAPGSLHASNFRFA